MTHTALMPQWLDPPAVPAVTYHWWDHGLPDPPPHVLDEITVFVPPYMPVEADVALARRMPRLEVVQALMAGVDGFLPHVTTGVRVLRAVGVHDARERRGRKARRAHRATNWFPRRTRTSS